MTEDEQQDGWTSKNRASLSFSYYAVLVALSLHLLNVLLIYYGTNHYRFASGLIGRRQKDRSNGVDKHPEGLIMLY